MFASKTLLEHLLRGAAGIGALWCAIAIAASHPWASVALGGLVLLAFRGCPICWSIGLFETVGEASKRRRDLSRRSAMDRAVP
ncbi:hypothetical protein [Bradyrhizobium lablabi]|uniref:hypothetical protein n=1 Tax=Bradyrhizobium lablabi TaxID=722472 RepID=UPI0007C65B66|nr:hypothetical protein [Bradyrhizobium lablabi]